MIEDVLLLLIVFNTMFVLIIFFHDYPAKKLISEA